MTLGQLQSCFSCNELLVDPLMADSQLGHGGFAAGVELQDFWKSACAESMSFIARWASLQRKRPFSLLLSNSRAS